MRWGRSITIVVASALACCYPAFTQTKSAPAGTTMVNHGGSAQGQLTVTLTIVPSSGVVIGPDGQPKVICANCADPRDNTSSLKLSAPTTDSDRNARQKKQK